MRSPIVALLTLAVVVAVLGEAPARVAVSANGGPLAAQVPAPAGPREQAAALYDQGIALYLQGDVAGALRVLEQALPLLRQVGDRAREAATLANLGDAYEQQGDLAGALDYYQQAIAAGEDVRAAARLAELKTSVAAQSVGRYERAALLLDRLGQPAAAFALAERGRARAFLDRLSNTPLDLSGSADARLVEQERALRAEIGALDRRLRQERAQPAAQPNREALALLDADLAGKQAAYAELLTRLALAAPETASLASVAPLDLAAVQAHLDADATLLSYYVTPERTLAFVVTRDRFQPIVLPVGEARLRAAVDQLRAFASPDDAAPLLQQLGDWLIAPVAEQLTTPVVGIVPHGVLHYLPFAALPVATVAPANASGAAPPLAPAASDPGPLPQNAMRVGGPSATATRCSRCPARAPCRSCRRSARRRPRACWRWRRARRRGSRRCASPRSRPRASPGCTTGCRWSAVRPPRGPSATRRPPMPSCTWRRTGS
jgi:hypothetical protein